MHFGVTSYFGAWLEINWIENCQFDREGCLYGYA